MARRSMTREFPLAPSTKRRAAPLTAIYITDAAWNTLLADAIALQYIKSDAWTAKGLTRYFIGLAHPHQVWEDRRPDYIRDLSTQLLDPANDRNRRKYTERTATYTFNSDLPLAQKSDNAPGPRHGIWWDPEMDTGKRRKRVFMRDQFPLQYYADLALMWGIGDPYHVTFQTSQTALASNAIEAIGRGTLHPTMKMPSAKPNTGPVYRGPNYKELEW